MYYFLYMYQDIYAFNISFCMYCFFTTRKMFFCILCFIIIHILIDLSIFILFQINIFLLYFFKGFVMCNGLLDTSRYLWLLLSCNSANYTTLNYYRSWDVHIVVIMCIGGMLKYIHTLSHMYACIWLHTMLTSESVRQWP